MVLKSCWFGFVTGLVVWRWFWYESGRFWDAFGMVLVCECLHVVDCLLPEIASLRKTA